MYIWFWHNVVMNENKYPSKNNPQPSATSKQEGVAPAVVIQKTGETGGPKGPEPTRYGDWEKGGRCTDF